MEERTLLTAGWRPAIGWAVFSSIVVAFVVIPLIHWDDCKPGTLDYLTELVAVVLVGVAGLRTIEKIKGVAK